MDMMENYKRWLGKVTEEDLLTELKAIEGNEEEINDRFYRDLEFGTGGLRGVIGAGTFRMNEHTVARATQGYNNNTCYNIIHDYFSFRSRMNIRIGVPMKPNVSRIRFSI